MPLIVVSNDAVKRAASLKLDVTNLTIKTADDANRAAALLTDLTDLGNLIESRRVEAKKPYLDLGRRIDDAAKPHKDTIDAALKVLRPKLAAWQTEQDRLARVEADRKRRELEQLEQQRKEAEERERQANAAVATAGDADLAGFDVVAAESEQAHVQQAQVNLQTARTLVPSKPAGIQYRTLLKFEVLDVRQLPSSLVNLIPNNDAIRRDYCTGWKEGDPVPAVKGIRFIVDKTPIVSSRR